MTDKATVQQVIESFIRYLIADASMSELSITQGESDEESLESWLEFYLPENQFNDIDYDQFAAGERP